MTDQEDFASLLGQFERAHAGPAKAVPQVGDRVRGRVLSIGAERAFVDLGSKSEGTIDVADLTDPEGHVTVAVGDPVEAVVLSRDDQSGTLLLGRGAGHRFHDSGELQQAFQSQLPVEGVVTGVTRGGVEVQVAGQRAFCPASQLDNRFVEDLQSFVGQRLTFRITRYQGGKHSNVVVSRRVLLEEEQRVRVEEMRARLEVGAVLRGTVTSIKDYGAFVDLGGIEGMVHVSELAHGRVAHPQDVLSVGQTVDVSVLRIEKTGNPKRPDRIALSIRALTPAPGKEPVDAEALARATERKRPSEGIGSFGELLRETLDRARK